MLLKGILGSVVSQQQHHKLEVNTKAEIQLLTGLWFSCIPLTPRISWHEELISDSFNHFDDLPQNYKVLTPVLNQGKSKLLTGLLRPRDARDLE